MVLLVAKKNLSDDTARGPGVCARTAPVRAGLRPLVPLSADRTPGGRSRFYKLSEAIGEVSIYGVHAFQIERSHLRKQHVWYAHVTH